MKRTAIIVSVFLALFTAVTAAKADQSKIADTKHNLSSSGTGSYKSVLTTNAGGTSEICVFCHTPHGGNTDAPLWNKNRPTNSYNMYSSDVLIAMGMSADTDLTSKQPHLKTLVCLSCHDGTIALGKLARMPKDTSSSYTQVQMSGYANIQTTDPGYIGTDLSDDHPVAIAHDNSKDTELKTPVNGDSPHVKLYGIDAKTTTNAGANNYVECTSCHEPHNNQYGNFLVDSNQGSKICTSCHNKTGAGYDSSIHTNGTASYSPPEGVSGNLGLTIGGVGCMVCHFPHKAGGSGTYPNITPASSSSNFGWYLLSYSEENTCFSYNGSGNTNRWGQSVTVCHGTGQSGKNIQDLMRGTKSSEHTVTANGSTAIHKATEAQTAGWYSAGSANKHVECSDCHNSHTAGGTSHTANPPTPIVGPMPTLSTSSPLYGAGGAVVNTPPSWVGGVNGNYTYRGPIGVAKKINVANINTGVSYEYQICLKCHSDFAWQGTGSIPTVPSLGITMTDQAMEFSLGNQSYHPVEGSTLPSHTYGTLVTNWNTNKTNQTMYCSDCHNNNILSGPEGPHGSNNKAILVGLNNYNDAASTTGAADATNDFCMICHDPTTYSDSTPNQSGAGKTGFYLSSAGNTNLHRQHAYRTAGAYNPINSGTPITNPYKYRCVNCHIRIPHGWNARKAMVLFETDAGLVSTYQPASFLSTDGHLAPITGGSLPASGGYSWTGGAGAGLSVDCSTAAGCHHN